MKAALAGALLAIAILLIVPSCQKQEQKRDQVSEVADQIRAFTDSKSPELKDKPLVMTLARRGNGVGVCACLIVCGGGRCTPCTCSPPSCGSCASETEVAPLDALFAK